MPQEMPARQAAFRADYRPRIAPAYAGWLHVALIFSLGGAAIWVCARQITIPAWYEWLVIPLAFCLSNVFGCRLKIIIRRIVIFFATGE